MYWYIDLAYFTQTCASCRLYLSDIVMIVLMFLIADPLILLSCCREARKSGNFQTANQLIEALTGYQSVTSSLRLQMDRESAKLLYSKPDSQQAALLDMVNVACYSNSTGSEDQLLSDLVARSVISSIFMCIKHGLVICTAHVVLTMDCDY